LPVGPITEIKDLCYHAFFSSPQEFLELAGRWATLQSNAIVKLYGVTLSSPLAMVMEYLSLGPLDVYLKEHKHSLKQVDLVEAGAFLATALWHLVCCLVD
jgi:Janus kinase 2/BCL2-associated athanogene 2